MTGLFVDCSTTSYQVRRMFGRSRRLDFLALAEHIRSVDGCARFERKVAYLIARGAYAGFGSMLGSFGFAVVHVGVETADAEMFLDISRHADLLEGITIVSCNPRLPILVENLKQSGKRVTVATIERTYDPLLCAQIYIDADWLWNDGAEAEL